MIRPEDTAGEERGLKAPDPPPLPAPLVAMAEALRANAEALHRLDQSQRRIAESIDKSERAQQVVASTRALNETFRGLSEIQRGLLDAFVKRGGGVGGGSVLLLLLAALLSGLLCVLVYDRWASARTVPLARHEEARAEAEKLRGKLEEMKTRGNAAAEAQQALERKLQEKEEALAAAGRGDEEKTAKIQRLEHDLAEKDARLEQYLAVKDQADLAAALQVQNAGLERENRDLKEKVAGLERQRTNVLEVFGEKLAEQLGPDVDPEQLKAVAKKMGIYEDPAPRPPPGVTALSRSGERLLVNQINRLLPDALESYDLVHATSLADGCRLLDVTLTRNRNRLLVNSLTCKEMVVHVDPESDTVELRLKGGVITNPAHPGEQVPIAEEGHSIFLPAAGVKEWLRREGDRVRVDAQGIVTWPNEAEGPRTPPASGTGGSKEYPGK